MRRLLLLGLVACGDNLVLRPDGEPLPHAASLAIVAHQDDDLLFMQPDEYEAVRSAGGVVNVYVTAGNGTKGVDYAELRGRALMAAYSGITGDDAWTCGWIDLAGEPAQHCRLAIGNVSLVFLGYPDGGKQGEYPHSLLKLWEGEIDQADTIGRKVGHYTQAALIQAVTEVIDAVQPSVIRTLEVSAAHGRDHADHMMVGALAILAAAHTTADPAIVSFRGYGTELEGENVIEPYFTRSLDPLARYEGCVDGTVGCGDVAPTVDDAHSVWMHRRYGVGFRRAAVGRLRSTASGECASADVDGSLDLVTCATAPVWTFGEHGHVQLRPDGCLQTLPTGELVVGFCTQASTYRLDDEGHIWAGVAPAPAPNMDVDHGSCLASSGGRVRAILCGATKTDTWQVMPLPVTSDRTALGLVRSGRGLVLADLDGDGKADLCEVDAALVCALGGGEGTFRPAAPRGALPIDPDSLVIGDVDGDGAPDACGRDASGILCSLGGAAPTRWSTAALTSLTIVDGKLCGQTPAGEQCAARDVAPTLIAPVTGDRLGFADLHGSGQPDWCALPDGGAPACNVIVDQALTTDSSPWSFSQNGAQETLSGALVFGDLDGDGKADLCQARAPGVVCARSQGHAFGPQFPVMETPATAVWLGDLDGDGKADTCVDDGAGSIICQRN